MIPLRPVGQILRSDRSQAVGALVALASFFTLGWLLVGSHADVPIIDDWVYAWSVEHLLRTGHLEVLDFSAIYPLTEIAWGALFARVLGFSFVTLRLSTVVSSVFGCWALYLTLRELGCRPAPSLLGAFAVACDPTFFAMSFSFMTDVPFVNLSMMALLFYVSATRRRSSARLWTAGALSVGAFLIRPIGIALPLSVIPVLVFRADWRSTLRRSLLPIGVPLAAMAALQVGLPRLLGALDWAAIRADQLRWWFTISPTTYLVWTIRVVLESVFPIAPLLLAHLVRWRRALAIAAVALLMVVPIERARGEIPSPLPDWQTWSLQDIGARSLIAGDATSSPWSARVMPIVRGLGLLTAAALILACAGGLLARFWQDRRQGLPLASESDAQEAQSISGADSSRRFSHGVSWSRGHAVPIVYGILMLAAIHVLWFYNDRYYLVFAPVVAIIAATALDADSRAQRAAVAMLMVWTAIAVSGTRDLLAFNEACATETRRLEAIGVPPYEIDAGYPLNGWRLYAHPERLPPGADRRYDVPFVTSDRAAKFTIMSHPPPGYDTVRVVPLPEATWQATHELYVAKKH